MRVQAGVVVDVDGSNRGKRTEALGNLLEQFPDITVIIFATRPAAVVVELVVKAAQTVFCGLGVAYKNG